MDEIRIESKELTALVSKVVAKLVSEKLSCAGISLNNLRVSVDNKNVSIHLDVDANTDLDTIRMLL